MKNVFLKSTIILIIGGIITKILSFFVRIVYTRLIGVEGVSLYSLTLPTYSLLITIAQLSLPTTISKLVAENKNNNLKIVSNATYIILFINTIVMIIMLLSSKYIAINLLHEEKTYILLISMSLTFPIISISSIIKGYFYGKQNVIPNVVSNIVEEIVRITLIIIIIPILLKKSVELAAASLFIITFIEEVISIIVNLLFLPKYIKINKKK